MVTFAALMTAVLAFLKTVWDATAGYKTYGLAAVLVVIGFVEIHAGNYLPAAQGVISAVIALGLRKQLAGVGGTTT